MSNKKRKATILFDKIIGEPVFAISRFLIPVSKVKPKKIKRILLIRPGGIGDFLLNIPAFKELNKRYPNANIDLLLFKRNAFCKQYYDKFNQISIIDKPSELIKFLLKKKDYDVCIDFDQHRKIPSILTMLSKARIRIGFKRNGKEKAYNFPVNYPQSEYESQSFMNLLKPLGILKKVAEKDLILLKSSQKKRDSVGIYAAAMKEDNRLSIQKWKEIIKKEGKNKNYYFFGGPKDKERYDSLEKELKEFKIHRRDGKGSLLESLKEISQMQSFISEDGGVYHMAVCTGTPTVSYWLHGKDNMNKWKSPFKKQKGVLLK